MVVLKAYFKLPVPGIKPRFPAHRALVSLASFCLALPMLLCAGACVGPTRVSVCAHGCGMCLCVFNLGLRAPCAE